ncbi:MAG: hypothetical protein FJY80_07715 [Candidatus Aminicenantes bacterium]|nr:hypothetical protein [Candidatus Aminicenantes bacterium]
MTRPRFFLVIGMAAAVLAAAGCKRPGIEEPSPFGPVSFGLSFELEARPNVIMATDVRPMAEIRATVRNNGQPVKDRIVYFTVLFGPGQFSDYTVRTVALTDSSGVAKVSFLGPTTYEIDADVFTTIKSQLETTTPEYIHKEIDIRILKGII